MAALRLTYDRLSADELQGSTQADHLVALDADFRIADGHGLIYEEPGFPVVELARGLRRWLDDPGRTEFEFDSMSFEEIGAVTVRRVEDGWVVTSVFTPDSASVPTRWSELEESIRGFLSRVDADLGALGIDPSGVTGR